MQEFCPFKAILQIRNKEILEKRVAVEDPKLLKICRNAFKNVAKLISRSKAF